MRKKKDKREMVQLNRREKEEGEVWMVVETDRKTRDLRKKEKRSRHSSSCGTATISGG